MLTPRIRAACAGLAALGLAAVAVPAVAAPGPDARPAGLPVPTDRAETPLTDPSIPDDVLVSEVKVRHPLPATVAPHPQACDWLRYLRFRHAKGPAESKRADAVFTAQPGLMMGAAIFLPQGVQVVKKSAARGKYVEYWALDRRSNCVEDHTGLNAARKARDPKVALDYYLYGKPVGGRKFEGWQSYLKLPYLADFGIGRTLDDWRAVIEEGMPGEARRKVLCGGHSYGGFLVGPMLSWDFDKNPFTTGDAGHTICGSGGYTLDGIAMNDPAGLKSLPFLDILVQLIGGGFGKTTLDAAFQAGLVTRDLDLGVVFSLPKILALFETTALAADVQPTQETVLTRQPLQHDWEIVLKGILSPSWAELVSSFTSGLPIPHGIRLTNRGLLGALFDNNSMWISAIKAGLGTFDGPMRPRTFPAPDVLLRIPVFGEYIARGIGYGHGVTPALPGVRVHDWRNYDKTSQAMRDLPLDEGKPVTNPSKEVTDLPTFARAMRGLGDINGWEWYFPTRQITDMVFSLGLGRTADAGHLVYRDADHLSTKTRVLTLLAGDGPVQNAAYGNIVPQDRVIVPGYQHLDMVTAAEKQNNGKPEQVSTRLVDFAFNDDRPRPAGN